jgi:TonB family protein
MDDRVADVLAQRRALGAGASAGIALSLLVHGALSALMVWAALHTAAIQMPRTVEIRLAPVTAAPKRSSEIAPPAVTTTAPVTKMEKPAPPAAQPPTKPPPPEKNTVPLSPFGKSPKKGAENAVPSVATPPPASPAAPPGPVGGTAQVPVGGTGVTGIEGGDFPYTLYIDRMNTLIGKRWYRPQGFPAGPSTTIHFNVDRYGAISDPGIETSSGNGTFDRAALRAVLESSPLPPLPFGYTGTYLGVHLTFR